MKKLLFSLTVAMLITIFTSGMNETSAATSIHTVKKGDTLYKISQQHKVSVTNIKRWNNLKSSVIYPNQKLRLVKSSKVAATTATKTPSRSKGPKIAKEFMVSATAYTAHCKGCSGITRTGLNLRKNPNLKVIAVDPRVIKLGTKVHVEGYGYAIAGDTGGAIKGKKIDVFIPNKSRAYQWGRKNVKVKVLN
ncbi:3D domain-containing protein [Sporosarcina sp. GW1-11]|uniref:3D domain-containing protein n=1 Tax=Sporosarcina sp. GW1-11 TaxID=2899126 RepID=UPI00294D01CC|nr:3D domain-containing protein [Sporosarcina sp. GW1-11]MDV6379063.1 3D domain-containing protein [Sporosarcina sp. GW1-11]